MFYGELLSEHAEQCLEFNEMGALFAVTDNDAYNALVCARFVGELGRAQVFQLPLPGAEDRESRIVARPSRGRLSPTAEAVYEHLIAKYYRGWDFRITRLTEAFSFEACRATCGEGAIPVLLVRENGTSRFNSVEYPLEPEPGDRVVWFGPKCAESHPDPSR